MADMRLEAQAARKHEPNFMACGFLRYSRFNQTVGIPDHVFVIGFIAALKIAGN